MKPKNKKRIKMRKQPNREFISMHSWDAESGDRGFLSGQLVDLYESNGYYKRSAGELSYREVKPPLRHPDAKPKKISGIWYWEWNE